LKEVKMGRPFVSTIPPMGGCCSAATVMFHDLHDGPWAVTVALRNVVMGWLRGGPAAALVLGALGLLLGLLSRNHLPTRSIFELM
jgi:hypothetical protein